MPGMGFASAGQAFSAIKLLKYRYLVLTRWSAGVLKTFSDFERRPDLLAKFDALLPRYSIACIFADVMYRQNVMTSAIKPAFKAKATGQAITVQLSGGDLVDPLRALEMGHPGDVIVVDATGDTETSVCGGLMGGLAKNRGIRAMIVDGAGRDVDELEDINWPIWTKAITARGTHTMFSERKEELSINVPISCGGIVVNPGDFIVADTNAVVVVPLGRAEEMLELALEQADREQRTREWVNQGKTIEDLLNEFGRI
jgi:4-hydroxy-4-methyl-2-oxoglutarate aldolase